MPVKLTDFSRAPIIGSPAASLFEDVLKGYQMSQAPKQIKEDINARQLANKLRQVDIENKPKQYALDERQKLLSNAMHEKALAHLDKEQALNDQYKAAQISRASRAPQVQGALSQALQLRNNYSEGTKERSEIDQYINKLITPKSGIQVSSSPEGGFEVNIGGQGEKGTVPNFGLRKGEVIVNDKEGNPTAIGRPLTEKQQKEEGGRASFNVYYDFINNAQKIYSGKDSNKRFERDVLNYAADPSAKERIDNYLAAKKLLLTTAIKEDATIGGANTNRAYNGLLKSLKSSQVFDLAEKIAPYQLPSGYAEFPNSIFQKVLNEGSEAAKNLPAYRFSKIDQHRESTEPSKAEKHSDEQKPQEAVPKTKDDVKAFYLSLTPAQRAEYRKIHTGGG